MSDLIETLRAQRDHAIAERDEAVARAERADAAVIATIADTAAAAEADRARIVEETAAPLRAEIERLTKGRATTAACLAALRDYPDADFSRHVVPAEESIGYHQAWNRDLAKGRAATATAEAERDTLAAALAEVRARVWTLDTDALRYGLGPVLDALPADLAAAHDRRVRAEALDAEAEGLVARAAADREVSVGPGDAWAVRAAFLDGEATRLRARAADERGGR